ncbi:ExbD/TolR family protein [Aestuariivita boseongensis]|uniref:ExbD/TolR family protein n=1 Tax=Aestuariivita boseongensis TaxID=1470562 RepID=UPI0006813BE0|nr:biopolymer transporter ExbD [Aestuariivita boseongensis]
MFAFAAPRPRRKPSLTPMIDVVFLLLVFFMLASRFGQDMALPLVAGTGAEAWEGAPRLVTLSDTGLALNGALVVLEDLAAALEPLMPDRAAPIVIQPMGGADLAALTALFDTLRAAGLSTLVLVEGER